LARQLREDAPKALTPLLAEPQRYKVEGSPGQGNWAKVPWISVFDILITESAQSGYYPVYLFRADRAGVYLSLNQGVTDVIKKYKSDARAVLKVRASDFRAQLGTVAAQRFQILDVELAVAPADRASFYEDGNIVSAYYPATAVPSDDVLAADFREIMRLYDELSYNENIPSSSTQAEDDLPPSATGVENLARWRAHKRLERNRALALKAKKAHGYDCQVCGFSFPTRYGELGLEFIEAPPPDANLGTQREGSRTRPAERLCRPLRQLSSDDSQVRIAGRPRWPPRYLGKERQIRLTQAYL
jgi:5-methylcytosine-specific restriction enzyme A